MGEFIVHQQTSFSVILIVLLVVFSIVRRGRQFIGWQKYNPSRLMTRIVIFSILGLLILGAGAYYNVIVIPFDILGLAIGVALAFIALRYTLFETRDGTPYYRPNTWIGALVLILFVGRIVFRFAQVYFLMHHGSIASSSSGSTALQQNQQNQMQSYTVDPWTSSPFMILIGYYICYFLFIRHRVKRMNAETQPGGTSAMR